MTESMLPKVGSFQSLGSKALTIAKNLAPIVGGAQAWLQPAMADGRGIEGAFPWIMEQLQHWHIANPLITTQLAMSEPGRYPIISGAAASIVGWLMEQAGTSIGSGLIKSVGTTSKRYGVSALINGLVSAWVYLARYNPTGTPGYSQGTQAATAKYRDTTWQERASAHIRNAAGGLA